MTRNTREISRTKYRWRFTDMHPVLQVLGIALVTAGTAGLLWVIRIFAWMIWMAQRGML